MGEKNGGKKDGGEKKKKGEDKSNDATTVVLKTDMHCEGCADKIVRFVKSIDGVEKAKSEWEVNKLTVRGEVDASELREKLQEKTKKKVELVSQSPSQQQPRKKVEDKANGSSDNGNPKGKKPQAQDKKPKDKDKGKEAPVTTVVLKIELHCEGCIDKIYKCVYKTKGVQSVAIDRDKDLVTAKGTMDGAALAKSLEEKMKKPVKIIPPKTDKDKSGGGEGGGEGKSKKKKDEGEDQAGVFANGEVSYGEFWGGNRMEYGGPPRMEYGGPPPGGYAFNNYGFMYGQPYHAPQMFSDENPNACSVM